MKKISFMLCAAALMLASTFTSCTNEDNSIYENDVVIRNGYYLNDIIEDAIEKSTGNEVVINLPDTIALRSKADVAIEIPEGKNVSIIGKVSAPARLQLKNGFVVNGNLTISNVDIDAKGLNNYVIYAAEGSEILFDGVTIENNYNELVAWSEKGSKVTVTNSDIAFSQIYTQAIVTIKDSKIKPSSIIYMGVNDVIIENTEIDAENNGQEIFMLKNPFDAGFEEANSKDCYIIEEPIVLKGLKIKNAKSAIFREYAWSNYKYVVKDFIIDDCVFELAPTYYQNSVINFNNGGIMNFTIQNSTVYNASPYGYNYSYFTKYNNSIVPDNAGLDAVNEGDWSWTIKDNTFYKVATSQWHNGGRISQQAKNMTIDIENNLWVDCAQDILRRILAQKNTDAFVKDPAPVVNGNTWVRHTSSWVYDEETEEWNEVFETVYDNASNYNKTEGTDIEFDPTFANVEPGEDEEFDFHCGAQNGDPRWK